jgi:hypothetical protein
MVRELDDVTLIFSLWQQARSELQQLESRLALAISAPTTLTIAELDELEASLVTARAKADRLLGEALDVLREYSKAGHRGA